MLLPLATLVIALGGMAFVKSKRPGVMTADRDRLYRAAIGGSLKTPEKLRTLADLFEKERLFPQAQLLRQRAALRELPDDIKKQRRLVFRRAMRSTNKAAVIAIANAYDKEGCTTACEKLRAYASGLPDVGPSAPPITPPPPDGMQASDTGEPSESTEVDEVTGDEVETSAEGSTANVQQAAE